METTALKLVKARLGITSEVRDFYLQEIVKGVMSELKEVNGLSLDKDSPHHLMFIVDLSTWRYQNKDVMDQMPRHLQFRLHNLIIRQIGGGKNESDV